MHSLKLVANSLKFWKIAVKCTFSWPEWHSCLSHLYWSFIWVIIYNWCKIVISIKNDNSNEASYKCSKQAKDNFSSQICFPFCCTLCECLLWSIHNNIWHKIIFRSIPSLTRRLDGKQRKKLVAQSLLD